MNPPKNRKLPPPETEGEVSARAVEREIHRMSRRSFLWAGLALGSATGGLYAFNRFAPESAGTKTVFRRMLEFNEQVSRKLFFSEAHRDRTFARSQAVEPRNNYNGNTPIVDPADWRLTLETGGKPRVLTLDEAIAGLPIISQTTELKCVEGWSAVVNWSGVRFVDFVKRFPLPDDAPYVAMFSEPEGWEDDWYYVGLDRESCLHPQTLLATGMNGQPLTAEHGAPMRLVIPHKYGIKNIKLITRIAYLRERPADYWADRGYDWYAGL